MALERVNDIQRCNRLTLGVLRVGDRIANYVLKEELENSAGLIVDQARDTLQTATASQAANRRFGNALDVVAQDLAVTLRAALTEALATLSLARVSTQRTLPPASVRA